MEPASKFSIIYSDKNVRKSTLGIFSIVAQAP